MSKDILKELEELYEHVTYYNRMAPFPVYDTEYVQEIKDAIDMITNSDKNYDELPVEACANCKNLFLVVDDVDNIICMRCNSINEVDKYDDIYEYKKENNIWNEE